ncbi:MAG: hypothetical protein NT168_10030, partial [Planctomycetota bacterium]|nr:hypothetical protein [Planctomycetota bacterium]
MASRDASKHGAYDRCQEATIGARQLSRRVGMLANMGPYIGADYRCQPPVVASRHASKHGAY